MHSSPYKKMVFNLFWGQCLSGAYDIQNGFFFFTDSSENQNMKSDICEGGYAKGVKPFLV